MLRQRFGRWRRCFGHVSAVRLQPPEYIVESFDQELQRDARIVAELRWRCPRRRLHQGWSYQLTQGHSRESSHLRATSA